MVCTDVSKEVDKKTTACVVRRLREEGFLGPLGQGGRLSKPIETEKHIVIRNRCYSDPWTYISLYVGDVALAAEDPPLH